MCFILQESTIAVSVELELNLYIKVRRLLRIYGVFLTEERLLTAMQVSMIITSCRLTTFSKDRFCKPAFFISVICALEIL